MSNLEYDICRLQGEIFEHMASQGYDMHKFSDLYMKSDFCRDSFDTEYSPFFMAGVLECMDSIMPEIGDKCSIYDGAGYFDPDMAWWIGFTYRQLYLETGVSSSELADKVPFTLLCESYPGLHTIDDELAIETLCESLNLPMPAQDLEQPVS